MVEQNASLSYNCQLDKERFHETAHRPEHFQRNAELVAQTFKTRAALSGWNYGCD
jgi:hypothetical protein